MKSRSWTCSVRGCGALPALLVTLTRAPAALAQPLQEAPANEEPPTEFSEVQSGGVSVTDPVPSPYTAADEERRERARALAAQRAFALVAVALPYDGFGLGIRTGTPRVGLDLSGAFRPVFTTYARDPDEFPKFRFLFGYQLNAALYFGLYRPNARTDLGFTLGYKYHTLLRHGVGAAFYLKRDLGEHFSLQFFVGPAVFPKAESKIRDKTGWEGGTVSSGIAWHQGGVGISFAFYP